nr:M48 family metalloprotease [Spirochaetota bacterium]
YQTDNLYQAIEYTEFNDKDMRKIRKESGLAYFPKKGELIGVEEAFINDRMASIGLSISVGVLQQGVVFDRALTVKMNALANILIRQTYDYDTRYYVFIIKDSEPVAFSGPGGYIFLSDKLLTLLTDYRELTAILAHEVGHIALRHGVRDIALEQARFSADKAFDELDEFLDEDTLAISKDLDNVIKQAREACKLVRDDKDEFEADGVSVEILRRYKIDKSYLINTLNKVTLALATKYPEYLSQTQRRIKKLKGN